MLQGKISPPYRLAITANQYRAGVVGYLNVISAQTTELANRKLALS